MADPLSIAGSIAGLITLGIQTTRVLYEVADGIGSAGSEVRDVAEQVTNLSNVLEAVQEKMRQRRSLEHTFVTALKAAIKPCRKLLDAFGEMLKPLQPMLTRYRRNRRMLEQIGLRVQWYIRTKTKVKAIREMLDRHLNCLQLALITMSIPDASSGSHISDILRSLFRRIVRLEVVHDATASSLLQRANDSRGSNATPTVADITPAVAAAAISDTRAQVEDVNEPVDASLEAGLEEVTDVAFMEIVLQTYTFEEVILEAAREAGIRRDSGPRTSARRSSTRPSSERSSHSYVPSSQQTNTAESEVARPRQNNTEWNYLRFPNGANLRVPHSWVNTRKGLLKTLMTIDRDVNENFVRAVNQARRYTDYSKDGNSNRMIDDLREADSLELILYVLAEAKLRIVCLVPLSDWRDNLKHWSQTLKPGMEVKFYQ